MQLTDKQLEDMRNQAKILKSCLLIMAVELEDLDYPLSESTLIAKELFRAVNGNSV